MKKNNILVSGSLAYDRIMDFPGFFKDNILADKIHILNICFLIKDLKESFGGTAGNIAYNLSLLEENPKVLYVVGKDFDRYEEWLLKNKINISLVKKDNKSFTAGAYIINDKANNQITAFYPGSQDNNYPEIVRKEKKVKLAIISPDNIKRMMKYAQIYREKEIPFIFDPGQQISDFKSSFDLNKIVRSSKIVIGNDYEIELILKKLKINRKKLSTLTEILVVTKGDKGSEIITKGNHINIKAIKINKVKDPTGAGDAYRAGFMKGLISGLDLKKSGQLASLVATYAISKFGTQEHVFDIKNINSKLKKLFNFSLDSIK